MVADEDGGGESWIEVSEERLAGNSCARRREAAGAETEVLAVVKANAYGHGAERCSVALARAGARWFGRGGCGGGARVRRALDAAGFARRRILAMCGFLPEDVAAIVEHRLTPVVWTKEQVGWLRGRAGMRVHVEIETGMGRQGVRPGAELDAVLDAIVAGGAGAGWGVYALLRGGGRGFGEKTREQQRRFAAAVAQVRERGLRPTWVHAGSSSSIDNAGVDHAARVGRWLVELAKSVGARAMVRCGIALYGYCLPIEGEGRDREAARRRCGR